MENVERLQSQGGRLTRFGRSAVTAGALLLIAACGGGNSDSSGSGATASGPENSTGTTPASTDTTPATTMAAKKPTKEEASRFLAQATFGPTEAEIDRLSGMTYEAWLDEQFAKPQTLHRLYINQAAADLATIGQQVGNVNFFDSWWSQALGSDDQLRQRAAFALSEIMVISFGDNTLRTQPRGVASYYDMLGDKAFGNFRGLLESVTLHPMMGIYLSHLKNEKEDPVKGTVPDLNFAREITQLFAVGEYELNVDGTNIMGSDGRPAVAYTAADLSGLSQVFTGFSWHAGTQDSMRTSRRFYGQDANLERDWRPMQAYNEYAPNTAFHSISAKKFWATTIAPQTKADPEGDLKIALDTIFNNRNVGPFIGKQLIQRLVTSNPSPAYVRRVATVFNDNGKGVRGDMKSVWKAILLDPEARSTSTSATYGKVREPLVRLANFLRAFNARSMSNRYTGIGNTDDQATRLNQTPMFAPTVFNFFRPGYVPSGKTLTDSGTVVPELQITNDIAVAGYMNYMRTWVQVDKNRDIQHDYTAELALATQPAALIDRMNLLLFNGTMPDALRSQISNVVASRVVPAPVYPVMSAASAAAAASTASGAASAPAVAATNQAAIDAAKLDRVYLAAYLSLVSPDYLVQR